MQISLIYFSPLYFRCEKCPSFDKLRDHLYDSLECQIDSEIVYQQWIGTDRTTLISDSTSLHHLIDMITSSIDALTSHSYTAKAQSKYLKMRKENIEDNSLLFLGDFAENFTFVIQDEIQSYHWSKQQATLHPVVIYFKVNSELLKHQSFCFISDDLHHDTSMVYVIQKVFLCYVKEHFPSISKIEYFSDGCAAQYKNKHNFINLCMHKSDFGFDAEWNFFATAHGKSPCDGIGGTVKRVTANESLKRTHNNQIINAEEMYNFCNLHFKEITFFYISKSIIDKERENLQPRFMRAKTIPGTRSFHRFRPINNSGLEIMRTSDQETHSIRFDFENFNEKELPSVSIGNYIACIYDNNWWAGIIEQVFNEEGDTEVKLMHFNPRTKTFKWPGREDKCLIPFSNILCRINAPTASTASGRQYVLSPQDLSLIKQKFKITAENAKMKVTI